MCVSVCGRLYPRECIYTHRAIDKRYTIGGDYTLDYPLTGKAQLRQLSQPLQARGECGGFRIANFIIWFTHTQRKR